jgi:CRISPR-associated endonuclease/helicase Cas3
VFAHSLPDHPESQWEPLAHHLAAVGEGAALRASAFGWSAAARAAGLLHDIGKASIQFQAYIRGSGEAGAPAQRGGVDHSTAGAREAMRLYGPAGKVLAFALAGHHAGLSDAQDLSRRLDPAWPIPACNGWEAQVCGLPSTAELAGPFKPGGSRGFARSFLIRMIFSCLVDADFVETERFYAGSRGEAVERDGFTPLGDLADRLQAHLGAVRRDDSPLNRLRSQVLDHATGRAKLPPGLFTLTVPTGGGKTLTSLSFALEHARRHGLRRVIYVIPFTSIIEQTAGVFRGALSSDDDILEHHASFDWEANLARGGGSVGQADAGEGADGLAKLRRAAENWEAPIVVTTAVQFFESLFANRTSPCRKLHNMTRAVIVLDEAQTLPLPLLRPCLAALDELARNYGSSIVLCTATQPAVRMQDGFSDGLDIPEDRELAPDPKVLYARLRRVQVERLPEPTSDETIAARFVEQPQMLCIVNSRAHARDLFQRIKGLAGAAHLTTLMCPRHRRAVLGELRERLKSGAPVRLVSTSLIEAGVDIDFPEVWRAEAGLDQVAQAAGRCNREGRLALGRVVVFKPMDHPPPHVLRALQSAAEGVLRRGEDPLTLPAMLEYFRHLYWNKGEKAFDDARLDGEPFPILARLSERARDLDFPFASIARAFRMIDEAMEPVIVPWASSPGDVAVEDLIKRVAASERPCRGDLRRLQQYVVPMPARARADWLARGALKALHPQLGDTLLVLEGLALYDPRSGLKLDDPAYRKAEDNIL